MKVILHICCAVCAAGAAERLLSEGHEVLGFFFNPNIHPGEEYQRRLEAAQIVASKLNFNLEVPEYRTEPWFREAVEFAKEPEGGKRCEVCFKLRLLDTYKYMLDKKADTFTTTLTLGPQKSAVIINRIGVEIGGERFLQRDFKKKAGFQEAMKRIKEWSVYHQNYCGCVYSFKEREEFDKTREKNL